eukprot:CAMPEP_0176438684 /NCGR_PEP_ID=MMETSP0127-20121128/19447_1 /TAXON_ID=938130 /ORGANISM="Platyophrya macrostoma, Strain WH" /LENGTH=40 /DNA_ID= /DNA_START= /DNA_END= /DNA_ORIENTATION=
MRAYKQVLKSGGETKSNWEGNKLRGWRELRYRSLSLCVFL